MTDQTSRLFAHYQLGKTTIFSAPDNRFCYSLYVPLRYEELDPASIKILVLVHGTGRMQELYRDLFAEFAEYHNCLIVAPLFPADVLGDGNMSGYKYIKEGDIRYDRVLIDIVARVSEQYGVDASRMMMFGFSGGAHFVHRFLMIHPERILAASVAAPGIVTLLDENLPWWVGIGDAESVLGQAIVPEAVANIPVQLVVGGADTETWEITMEPSDRYYLPGINDSGRTRLDRLRTLAASLSAYGANVRLETVEGETHNVEPIARRAKMFFQDVLSGKL